MKSYKTVLYSAVIYSVIIGAVYVAFAILALLARWCVIEMTGGPVAYMMFLLYFRVPNCEKIIQWDIFEVSNGPLDEMPDETETVQRTFIFVLVCLGLHAALIVTALFGLCGVNNSCLGRKSFVVFIAPWAIVWVGIIVLDVLASVYFIIDTISATSVDGIMEILEVDTDEFRSSFDQLADHHRYLPPILMLLASSKLFIFLMGNIVWVIFIVKAGWTASTYHKYLDQTRRNYENTMANVNPAFEALRDDAVAQKQQQMVYLAEQSSIHEIAASTTAASAPPTDPVETRYNDPTRIQVAVYPYQKTQQTQVIVEEDPKYQIQRPSTLVIPPVERPQQQQYNRNEPNDREIDSRLSRYQEINGNAVKNFEPLNDIPELQQSNTRVRVLPPVVQVNRQLNEPKPQMGRSQSELKQKPIPPPKPVNNRYSMQPYGNESPVLYRPERVSNSATRVERNSSSIRAPEELRSQLPWSYFKPREDVPRRAFNDLDENEETPTVPVPDYTLHYGRRERTKLNDSDGDGSWNHQRY